MLSPLSNRSYRWLFLAQVAALLGTGLATIALSLLAHRLAGAQAGEILGAVLSIKMIAYIAVAPVASAIAANVPRKSLLIGLDVVRAVIAAVLPFVSEAWQIYGLMAVLYGASAAFTPAFQAMIPDILKDEGDYTKALSLSRLAADMESVASPILAVALLAVLSFHSLFAGTAVGFVLSACLIAWAVLPKGSAQAQRSFLQRLTAGLNLFAHTPRLHGVVAVSLATAAGGAMVFVNTVVIVQSGFGLSERATALALAAFGAGSIAAALTLPRLLERRSDRSVVIAGALLMAACLIAGALGACTYVFLLVLWALLGVGYALSLTPIGRVLRRSAYGEDRPALFAAQFALSHACWLIAYPVAGFVSATSNVDMAFVGLSGLCVIGALLAGAVWPGVDRGDIEHSHNELPLDHPHLSGGARAHVHDYVIDALHPRWPR